MSTLYTSDNLLKKDYKKEDHIVTALYAFAKAY